MIAFKTFIDCPENQKPAGIPDDWPWQERLCAEEQTAELEAQGFTVMTDEEYAAHKISLQTTHSAWVTSYQQSLIHGLIDKKIKSYQNIAPTLIRELYVLNTLNGITTVQSDQMFDDYYDVLTRIREGAFPTALRRLQFKRPSGFVTQALIDQWTSKIMAAL